MKKFIFKGIALFLAIVMVFPTQGFAQVLPYMSAPYQLLNPSVKYDLPTLKGIKFEADNPLKFTFVFNRSNLLLDEKILRSEAEKIGKYFLAALTIPEDDLWVNLSPYEENRIMPDSLSMTDLGKDMLGEDYVLKQLAASLTYPDSETGKAYWQLIKGLEANNHSSANNFNKVWIIPDKIHIYESPSMVVIDYARLKVLCEEDYLAMQKNVRLGTSRSLSTKRIGANGMPSDHSITAFKTYILPVIEREVNVGKHFAHLRQLYSAIILATWFKDKLKNSVLNATYFGKGKIKGLDISDPKIKEKIYNEYVKAFKVGVYNIIKRERVGMKMTQRQYFSGGVQLGRGVRAAIDDTIEDTDSNDVQRLDGLPRANVEAEKARLSPVIDLVKLRAKKEREARNFRDRDLLPSVKMRVALRVDSLLESAYRAVAWLAGKIADATIRDPDFQQSVIALADGLGPMPQTFDGDTGARSTDATVVDSGVGRVIYLATEFASGSPSRPRVLFPPGELDSIKVQFMKGIRDLEMDDLTVNWEKAQIRTAKPKIASAVSGQGVERETTGGLDFAKVKNKKTTVANGGMKLGVGDALAFLQSPDFSGLVLRVESVKLK